MPVHESKRVWGYYDHSCDSSSFCFPASIFLTIAHVAEEHLEPGPDGQLISSEERLQRAAQRASQESPTPQIEVSDDGEYSLETWSYSQCLLGQTFVTSVIPSIPCLF